MKKLREYLRSKSAQRPKKGDLGSPSEWLPVSKLNLAGPKLLIVDPSFAPSAENGLLVEAAPGNYEVAARCLDYGGDRRIARLRVLSKEIAGAELGDRIGEVWADTGAIGILDHQVFSKAWGDDDDTSYERIRETLEEYEACDVAVFDRAKGAVMPFVESGFGDGTFPVFELIANGKRVGVEIEFITDDAPYAFEHSTGAETEEPPVPFVDRLRAVALEGDGARANELALHYVRGDGVPEDPARARGWFRYALKHGYARAGDNLGVLVRDGLGGAKDVVRARRYFEMAAEMNQPDALNNLGALYKEGIGVPVDLARAKDYFEKAAKAGSAAAQFNLGLLYSSGLGVAKDVKTAFSWYSKSAKSNFARAQCNLGYCYLHGIAVDKDPAEAVVWFRMAAEQGSVIATINLGDCYQTGSGVPQNPKEAVRLFESVRDQHPLAALNLGDCYEKGLGVKRSAAKAFQFYAEAAQKGLALAQYRLGCHYERGSGTRKNLLEARKQYELAAEQGNEEARTALARLNVGSPGN